MSLETALVILDRASGPVRGIRREVRGLQTDAEGAGRVLDDMAGPRAAGDLQRLAENTRNVRVAVRGVRDELPLVSRAVEVYDRRLVAATRDTDRMTASTDRLVASLRTLGAIDARPSVHLDGVAEARMELAALRGELRAFGASRATARAGVSGVAGGVGGGFGGGVGRTAAYAGSDGFGVITSRTGLLAGAALTALPVVQALGGATVALGGSLMGAGLGAGGIGLAGGGVLTAGVGALASVAIPAKKSLEEAQKAQDAYTAAVEDFGRRSREAIRAKRELDAAMATAPPGTAGFMAQRRAFGREWRQATQPAQTDLLGLGTGAMRRVRQRALPSLAANAGVVSRATREQGLELTDFMTGPRSLATMSALSHAFADNLDEAEGAAEGLLGTVGNIARASLPFFHEGMDWLERTTRGWEKSTHDIHTVRREMGGYVDDLKAWGDLTGSAFELAHDVLMGGRPAGRSMVEDLTSTLDRWDRWVDRNPQRIDEFFRNAVDDTERLAGGVASVVRGLHDLADDLRPLVPMLERFGDAAGFVAGLGPGGIAIAAGALGGLRGRGAGRAAGGGGSAGLGAAAIGAAGGAAWLSRGRATYGAGRALGAGRVAAGAGALPGLARGGGGAALRGAAGKALPIAGIFALLDAYGFEGTAGQRLQAGASTALSTLTLGASDSLLSRPQTRSQLDARSDRIVGGTIEQLSAGESLAAVRRDIATLQERRGVARGMDIDLGSGAEREDRIHAIERAFDEEIRIRRGMARDLKRDRNERSREHAGKLTTSFGEAYDTLSGRYGPEQAMQKTVDDVHATMRGMNRVGAQILGENVLGWADAQARANPALLDEVESLNSRIRRSFSKTGEHVEIVNGKIRTGSAREWKEIAAKMIEPAERARQEVSSSLTAIQQLAIGTLHEMGYSMAEARAFVAAGDRGDFQGQVKVVTGSVAKAYAGAVGPGRKRGIGDGIGDGSGGGHVSRAAPVVGAGLMGANADLAPYAAVGAQYGSHVTSGLRRGARTSSGNRSYHASGSAIDLAGGDMLGLARTLATRYGPGLEELIYSPLGYGIKNGRPVPLSAFGPKVIADHYDHVHVADGAGAGAGILGQNVRLPRPGSSLRGVPGALSAAASNAYASGLEAKLNAVLGAGAGPGAETGGGLAAMIAAAGLPPIFNSIVRAESGGNANARNPSGASGLAQIMLPLHAGLVQRHGGSIFDPMTNLRVARDLYEQSGLAPWAASRGVWGRGDGEGWDRPTVSGGGPILAGSGRAPHVISVNAPVSVHGSGALSERHVASLIEHHLGQFVDQVLAALESGDESTDTLL